MTDLMYERDYPHTEPGKHRDDEHVDQPSRAPDGPIRHRVNGTWDQ